MIHLGLDTWTKRYRDALAPGEIRQRAEVRGAVVQDVAGTEIEVACQRLQFGLEAVQLVTAQVEAILRAEIERALAHALHVYADPHAALAAAYGTAAFNGAYMPTVITGLAGVGKTRLRLMIQKVLAGRTQIGIDAFHPNVPLIDYADCVIAQQHTVMAALRPLANPEVASGRVRMKQGDLPAECARWQRVCGVCLLGVDEMQFMAQSEAATTLITRTLLALADVRIPWFVIANYSLCWKLLHRPSEAMQRLLGRPVVILPDPPASDDWAALLTEYQVVLGEAIDFVLLDKRVELWNLCAGLKRELVKLLVLAYRAARREGAGKATWLHVRHAFDSKDFFTPRRDINLLIAHAGQGGRLRKDLQCPFEGDELTGRHATYSDQLRSAREGIVARATVEAAMTGEERRAIEELNKASLSAPPRPAEVIPLTKRRPRTLENLLQAGRELRETLGRDPDA